MADETNIGEALDWDMGEASGDGAFQLLPEGVYAFGVEKLEKEYFEGSAKMAACPRAHLTLSVVGSDGTAGTVHERLMLNTKVLWRVARFFESLGFQKNPETGAVPVAWNRVEGAGGYLKLKVREYTKKDGSKGQSNEVDEFLAPGDPRIAEARASAAQPQQTEMPVPPQPAAPQPPHQAWSV